MMDITAVNLKSAFDDTPEKNQAGFLRCFIEDLKLRVSKYPPEELEKIRLWAEELVNNNAPVHMRAAEIVDIIRPKIIGPEFDECCQTD